MSIGIESVSPALAVAVYPNPNSDSFTVVSAEVVTIEVRNSIGQVVLSRTLVPGENRVSLENASSGIYMISSTDAQGNKTAQRLVITK